MSFTCVIMLAGIIAVAIPVTVEFLKGKEDKERRRKAILEKERKEMEDKNGKYS